MIDHTARAARYARMPLASLRAHAQAQSVRRYSVVQANLVAEIEADLKLLRAAIKQRVESLTPELEALAELRRQLAYAVLRPHNAAAKAALQTSLAHLDVARGLLADQAAAELETEVAA